MKKILFFFLLLPILIFAQDKPLQLEVYFGPSSAEITPIEQTKIKDFFKKNDYSTFNIDVTGFTDDVGDAVANQKLSLVRAQEISNLIFKNFKLKTRNLIGKGEVEVTSTVKEEIASQRKASRKAIIFLEKQENKKSTEKEKVIVKTDEKVTSSDKVAKLLTAQLTKKAVPSKYKGYKTLEEKLEVGDKIVIEYLFFIGGRTAFEDEEEAQAELKQIVAFFQKNPNLRFEIQGHVCCFSESMKDARDLDTGKNNLSESRAKKIYDYFVTNGIPAERMTYAGYGRKFPYSKEDENLNKRVEILITKM